ncbi:response regulator [Sulfurospirillum sp. T05]|uniref:Response regulator n=1 Tax=Sulfurospirillum tamanense TaxID=2813362 RepID=A0ABS2WUQ1_9BACT|nr:response regulator [Sulfurospirillum tamanensis]MBN2965235.1 response regulator [Sulfurospirillum tamanensis]
MAHLEELLTMGKTMRILYVEDDEALREELTMLLSDIFDTIVLASNGEEGLAAFQKTPFDLVITDIRMPKMDGIAMIEAMRAIIPNQPIVVTSAHDETEYLLKLIALGVDSFITKPLSSDHILQSLHKSVGYIFESRERARYQEELKQLNASLKDEVARQSKDLKVSCAKAYAYQNAFYKVGNLLLLDTHGEILRVSPGGAGLLGFEAEELIGKSCAMFFHAQNSSLVYEGFLESIMTKAPWQGEVVCQTKTMQSLHVSLSSTPVVLDHEVVEFLVVLQDQTKAQAKLEAQSNETCLVSYMYKHIVDAIPLPAVVLDARGCATFHNFGFVEMVEEGFESGLMYRLKEGTLRLDEMILTEDPFLRMAGLWEKKPKGFEVQGLYETVLGSVDVHVYVKPLDKNANNYLAIICQQGARG